MSQQNDLVLDDLELSEETHNRILEWLKEMPDFPQLAHKRTNLHLTKSMKNLFRNTVEEPSKDPRYFSDEENLRCFDGVLRFLRKR